MRSYARTMFLVLATLFLPLFFVVLLVERTWASQPLPADPCASEWQGKVDENGYAIEWCIDSFSSGDYGFSFRLPQKRIGYPYPFLGSSHGFVFPLGPLRKEEEHRELLIFATYNLMEDEQGTIKSLGDQLQGYLNDMEAQYPGVSQKAVFSQKMRGDTQFLCFSINHDPLFTLNCQGVNKDVMYFVTLSSTVQHMLADRQYYDTVFSSISFHD